MRDLHKQKQAQVYKHFRKCAFNIMYILSQDSYLLQKEKGTEGYGEKADVW